MSELSPPSPKPLSVDSRGKKSGRFAFIFVIAVLLLALLVTALLATPLAALIGRQPLFLSQNNDAQRLKTLQNEIDALRADLDHLEARVATEKNAGSEEPRLGATDSLSQQSAFTSLADTVKRLEGALKDETTTAEALRRSQQTALAETLSLLQLKEAVAEGRPFESELKRFNLSAKNDAKLTDSLTALSPYAAKGVLSIKDLRTLLDQQKIATEVLIAKDEAHEWWTRLLAEFHGVISIRPLEDGKAAQNMIEMMDASLAAGDIRDALEQMKSLPLEAQKNLQNWRQAAEARLLVDHVLADLSQGTSGAEDAGEVSTHATPDAKGAP